MGEDVAVAPCELPTEILTRLNRRALKARLAPRSPAGEVVADTQVLRPKAFAAACEARLAAVPAQPTLASPARSAKDDVAFRCVARRWPWVVSWRRVPPIATRPGDPEFA